MAARSVTYSITFSPQATSNQINLSGIPGFNVKKLVAIQDLTAAVPIYAAGEPGLGFSAIDSTGTILTLEAPLATCSPTDLLYIKYDDGDQASAAGYVQLVVGGTTVNTGNPLPVFLTSQTASLALDATVAAVTTAIGYIGAGPPTMPGGATGLMGLLRWLGGVFSGVLTAAPPGGGAPSGSFTRLASAATYAAGQMIANSNVAADVVPVAIPIARANGLSVRGYRLRLWKTGTSIANAIFRAHFYSVSPICANGDGGAWSTNQSANYMGSFDVTMDKSFTDGSQGIGLPTVGARVIFQAASAQTTVYALLEAMGPYASPSGETFGIALELERD